MEATVTATEAEASVGADAPESVPTPGDGPAETTPMVVCPPGWHATWGLNWLGAMPTASDGPENSQEGGKTIGLLGRLAPSVAGVGGEVSAATEKASEPIVPVSAIRADGSKPLNQAPAADRQTSSGEVLLQTASKEAAAEMEAASASKPALHAADRLPAPSGRDSADASVNRLRPEADDSLPPAVRRVREPLRPSEPMHPVARPVSGSEDVPLPSRAAAGSSLTFGTGSASTDPPEALRGFRPPGGTAGDAAGESLRTMEAASDRGGPLEEQRAAVVADSGEFRQGADDPLASKMPAGGKALPSEGEGFAEGLAAMRRELPPSAAAEGNAEKTADGPAVANVKEDIGGTGRSGVLDQMVQRAAVHLKDGHGEISIDLKPEFLGRVRMQIATENQQVTVRIVTDLPAVRDLIESGLTQLKSELQSQGLQVERLEVAVADDHRQRGWQSAPNAQGWKGAAASPSLIAGLPPAEVCDVSRGRSPHAGSAPTIDMFV
jgi:hypothetical protein